MCTDRIHDAIGYYNLLMIKNPHWKQLRAYLTPSLSLNKIKRMYSLVDQVGDLVLVPESIKQPVQFITNF